MIFSNAAPCAGSRGYLNGNRKGYSILFTNIQRLIYPSIKKPVGFWIFAMAAAKRSSTTSLLTSPPFFIVSESSVPFGDPDWTSALNKSPVDKWAKLYFLTMRSHCVPLPHPGPPNTQIIGTFESITWNEKIVISRMQKLPNHEKSSSFCF